MTKYMLRFDIQGVIPSLENGEKAQTALDKLPGNASDKAHAVVSTRFHAQRDLPIDADRKACRDSIVAELVGEEIEAYRVTCHACDHGIKNRRRKAGGAQGCGEKVVLAEYGEMGEGESE